jgi:PAS domain S-box-containing protein
MLKVPPLSGSAPAAGLAERLSAVLHKAGLSAWAMDLSTGAMSVHPESLVWFGGRAGAALDRDFWLSQIHEDDRDALRTSLRTAQEGGALDARYRLASEQGSWFWIEGFLVADERGGKSELFGLIGELGSGGARPLARRHSDSPPGPLLYLARLDASLRYRWANHHYLERAQIDEKVLLGGSMQGVLGEASYAILAPILKRALSGEDCLDEIELPIAQHGLRVITLAVLPEQDARGRVRGVLTIEADITDLKRSERALFEREREFKTIVENSPDIVARLDRQARHLYINRAAELPFGLAPSAFIGKTLAELHFPDNIAQAYAKATVGVFESGRERAFSFVLPVAGQARHYTARAIAETDPSGSVESVLVITYDVTQRTKAEAERDALLIREQAARLQAEAAARARDEFLAIVSHELRSPLNGIQSWTHVLENYVGNDSPPVMRALAGIKLGVQQQVRLIEDLLDATLVMTGKLRLVKRPVAVGPVVDAAVESLRTQAHDKHIELVTEGTADHGQVEGDPERMQQIVWNLLSNAIKFTPENGRVRVVVEDAPDEIVITVQDTGKGIGAGFLPYLFDPFRQADGSSTRRAGGIGLGLTLVRRLTELHGGRVTVESEGENRGARFSVHLPRKEASPGLSQRERTVQAAGEKSLASLAGRHVVLVDDQREARDSLAELLEQAGAVVTAFGSGVEAVEHFNRSLPAERPDVLICDIAMPEQDGYVTLQKIRGLERVRPREGQGEIPAVALTAFSQREDKIRALANGFQVHLAKPVDPGELIGVIDTLSSPGLASLAS